MPPDPVPGRAAGGRRAAVVGLVAAASAAAAAPCAAAGSWTEGQPNPFSPFVGSSMACAGDLCYVTGGVVLPGTNNGQNDVYTFNLTSGAWGAGGGVAQLLVGRVFHASAVVWDSPTHYTVWAIGGQLQIEDGNDIWPTTSTEYYDPDVGAVSFSLGGGGPHGLVVVFPRRRCGGWRFCCGPLHHSPPHSPILFPFPPPPPTPQWTAGPPIGPFPPADCPGTWHPGSGKLACTAAGTTLVCAGGHGYARAADGTCPPATLNHTWTLDLSVGVPGAWRPAVSLPTGVCLATLVWLGGSRVLLAGGAGGGDCFVSGPGAAPRRAGAGAGAPRTVFNNAYILDLNNQLVGWEGTWPLSVPRFGVGGFVDPGTGLVYVVGGSLVDGGEPSPVAEVEVLDPSNSTNQWAHAPILPTPSLWAAVAGRTSFNWTPPAAGGAGASGGCANAGAVVQGLWNWYDWYTVNITALWSACP